MNTSKKIIEVKNLYKYYKDVTAVSGISFEVYEGEIFGIVGPNGAGKTTTLECIEGLKKQDEGEIKIIGDKIPIGIQLQEGCLPRGIKVKEIISLTASLYSAPLQSDELLKKIGLLDKKEFFYGKLSGGEKRRLHLAIALIGNPKILFLDEITSGFDPQAQRDVWNMIKELKAQEKTILLTTHYMKEAQILCDRVCIIDKGKIICLDTPKNIIRNLNIETKIIFSSDDIFDIKIFHQISSITKIEVINNKTIIYGRGDLLSEVISISSRNKLTLQNLEVKEPALEDAYLILTGKEYKE